MTRDEATAWAINTASEIARREGGQLALSSRELNFQAVEADSTLLGAAIARALIEAFDRGVASGQRPRASK